MRKAVKQPDSKILTDQLSYTSGNNEKIAAILLAEQKQFCAYTDEHISRTDAKDIEHFNPTLKNTADDGYHNWFLVKHQWNKEKSAKWDKYQPLLHPTASDFEDRVIYVEGDYIAKSAQDLEANNLIGLLQLDNAALADKRKRYINRKSADLAAYGGDANTFFTTLINDERCGVSYPRAIKEVFGVDVWEMLP